QRLASLLTRARSLCVTAHAEPGVTLEWHWNDPETSRLLAERWDYVVLQEQSERAYDQPAQMDAWLTAFAQKVRHAGAAALLFARCMVGPLNEPAAYTFDEPPRFLYRALLGEHPQIAQREGNAAYRAVERRAVTCIAPNR